MATTREKKDAVIIATTGRKGRVEIDEVFEKAANSVREDLTPDNSLDFYRDIEFQLCELADNEGIFIAEKDKQAIIGDLTYMKARIDKLITEFENTQSFEGE